jgi:hypothetical protein
MAKGIKNCGDTLLIHRFSIRVARPARSACVLLSACVSAVDKPLQFHHEISRTERTAGSFRRAQRREVDAIALALDEIGKFADALD